MNTLDLTPVFRTAIGFDRMANLVDSMMTGAADQQSNWPPYNIEKHGEDDYRISMAVAGFAEDELDVTVHDQMLIITGTQSPDDKARDVTYLHRGIAGRNFERRFQLADFINVNGASIRDGLLHIDLQRVIPDAMKPRKISISAGASPDAKPKIVAGKAS
ncbi:MAG: Hsp20 family protein [Alphaproteobacteria bacterium]|nr:Hsp20 family protein [Alphaproteobacteria bacterium]